LFHGALQLAVNRDVSTILLKVDIRRALSE